MKLSTTGLYRGVTNTTNNLIKKALNPLCGLTQQIGFVMRGSHEPTLLIAGAELCGVHVAHGKEAPKLGAYHIGGGGVFSNEALVKCLGESLERYSQLMPNINGGLITKFASYQEMKFDNEDILDPCWLIFFSENQLKNKNFPFQLFDEKRPLTWVKIKSVISKGREIYAPLQLLSVGYQVEISKNEPWLASAVTTGTAVHTTPLKAMKNALMELIQLDSAMGHWYTDFAAYEIILDERTTPIKNLLRKYTNPNMISPRFFWLKNADLEGFVVACLMQKNSKPRHAIGLGSDTNLLSAMYSAFIEATGVLQLAKINLLNQEYSNSSEISSDAIYNLDDNVSLYAEQDYSNRIQQRLLISEKIKASLLPKDIQGSLEEQVKKILKCFKNTNKELYWLNSNMSEANDLGLFVARVWSPQLLSLAIPSAAPIKHLRFLSYGGICHADPHPYP